MSLGTALEFGQLRCLGTGFGCFKLVALFLLKFNIFALGRGTYFRCFHSIAATLFSFYQFLPPVRPWFLNNLPSQWVFQNSFLFIVYYCIMLVWNEGWTSYYFSLHAMLCAYQRQLSPKLCLASRDHAL